MLQILKKITIAAVLLALLPSLSPFSAALGADEQAPKKEEGKRAMLKTPLSKMSIFSDVSVRNFNFFETDTVVAVENNEAPQPKVVKAAAVPASAEDAKQVNATDPRSPSSQQAKTINEKPAVEDSIRDLERKEKKGPIFVDDYKPEDSLPPDQTHQVRLNKHAPTAFIDMTMAYHKGDNELAEKYADSYVRYQQNLFFEVRQLSAMIGRALVRQKVIEEDDWDGVQQYLDYFAAKERDAKNALLRPTQEAAMRRIKPDPKGKADVYFFFTLNCSYCRYMAPEVERLWRATKDDPNVRMVGVTLGAVPDVWIEEYRAYTGATFPILDGAEAAKSFDIKFVPALVVRSPTKNVSYFKSGQQSFSSMYEFVRTVQGVPAAVTPNIQKVIDQPIGEMEMERVRSGEWKLARFTDRTNEHLPMARPVSIAMPKKSNKVTVERF